MQILSIKAEHTDFFNVLARFVRTKNQYFVMYRPEAVHTQI